MTTFEHLTVGQTFSCGSHLFTAEDIKRFAAMYDPQPFHTDEIAAADTHFGGLCASGWHTAAAMMRRLVNNFSAEIEASRTRGEAAPSLGPSLGFDDLKWRKPVYAGDTIAFSGRIVAKRASETHPGWETVSLETTGINQHGETVFSFVGHLLVAKTTPD